MSVRRRRPGVVAAGAVVVLLVWMAAAFACTSAAVLYLSPARGPAGAQVTVEGIAFSVLAPVVPVVLRWNGVTGPDLAQAIPNKAGEITVTFTVPQASPGYYVVVAV